MSLSKDYPAVPVGGVIADRYRVIDIINSGGMSKVYKVVDDTLQQTWCLKEIRLIDEEHENATAEEKTYRDALIYEAIIMSKLQHPLLPRIVNLITDNRLNRLYAVMDWVDGQSLQSIINKRTSIPVDVAIKWIMQICEIMRYLHSGYVNESDGKHPILYRDLKPSNVIRRDDGNICILDFGISIEITSEDKRIENPMGTVGFAAPELYQKNAPCDLRSDIYAIGATLLTMLTGKQPGDDCFIGWKKTASSINQSVSPEIDAIIIKAMQPNPDDRFQTVGEMMAALESASKSNPDHIDKLKFRRTLCLTFLAFSIFCGALSVVPKLMMTNAKEANYAAQLSNAEFTKNPKDYISAIAIKPSEIEPYFGLIEAYQYDGVFTVGEETTLKDCIFPNSEYLKDNERYGELAYDMGMLYWHYYEGENPEINALSWFVEAKKYNYNVEQATVYIELGNFTQDMLSPTSDIDRSETVKKYWDNLKKSKQYIEGDLMRLRVYTYIADCITQYSYQLSEYGIEKSEVEQEVKEIKSYLKSSAEISKRSDRMEKLYTELSGRIPTLEEKIELAYQDSE